MSEDDYDYPRVAVQGAPGCFSESAARQVLGEQLHLVSCRSFDEVASALSSGASDYAVFPIQNTIAGPVTASRQALSRGAFTRIAEIVLPIEQCLLVLPGATVSELTSIISHPVALAQCGDFLASLGPIRVEAVWDTAGAAEEVASQADARTGAIAGRAAAARYGLEVARAGIGDNPDNATTFVVVRAADHSGSGGSVW